MDNPERIAGTLSVTHGIQLSVTAGTDAEGPWCDLRPAQSEVYRAFTLRLRRGVGSVSVTFAPEAFAGPLVQAMGFADENSRACFARIASVCIDEGAQLSMAINDMTVAPERPAEWPENWNTVGITVKRHGVLADCPTRDGPFIEWAGRLLAMLLTLLPVEPVETEGDAAQGVPEGALTRVEVNHYERNPRYRATCIAVHGVVCCVCGFDFGATYGAIGSGFIHVHHRTPVSQLGATGDFDPIEGLAPVCPNCHVMLHTSDPPVDIQALKSVLEQRAGDSG